jgi:hypothetical protein
LPWPDNLVTAYQNALRTDPVSAFGGIVATNREIDAATAEEIVKVFTEVIVAPSATPGSGSHHRGQEEPAPAADWRYCRSQGRWPRTSSQWRGACWCSRAITEMSTIAISRW